MLIIFLFALIQVMVASIYAVQSNGDLFGMNKLMENLFKDYNKEILPTKPVIVSLNLLMLKVKTTVEREGIFESVVALFLEWFDPRIAWDPALYNNVSELTFDSDKVWLPDIALTNSAEHIYSISKDRQFVIRVTHKGVFDFVPTGTAKTWCELKLLTFPFDVQKCPIEFESWSLNTDSLQFNKTSTVIIDPSFSSLQFSLCDYSTRVYEYYYKATDESFSRLKFDFVVRRKSSFYLINLIFPIATLSLTQTLVFFIPLRDSSSDRVGFGTTNMLTLVVFQTMITEEMPKTSDAVTALSKYIIMLIVLSGWAIFESVFVERLIRLSAKPPPYWLSYILERICPVKFEHFTSSGNPHYLNANDDEEDNDQEDDVVIRPKRNKFHQRKAKLLNRLGKICCITTLVDEGDQLFVIENSTNSRRIRRSLSASAVSPASQVPGFVMAQWNKNLLSNSNNTTANDQSTTTANDNEDQIGPLMVTGRQQHVHFADNNNTTSTATNNRTKPPSISEAEPVVVEEDLSAKKRRRRQSSQMAIKIHRINKERWEDLAARIDLITFLMCAVLSVMLPLLLFLPLTAFDDTCPQDILGSYEESVEEA